MLFDDPEYVDIPIEVIKEALHAEGLPVITAEGPIYRHILFNLTPEEYRIAQVCSVTELTCARLLRLIHPYLGLEMSAVEKMADAIEKVMTRLDELRRHATTKATGSAA
jgi:hypothetical protein